MTKETIEFKAEVAKVLDIVIHSLYSHKEIFLRELISNATDACDKLRYATLIHPELSSKEAFKITLVPNKKDKTLTIKDNGIGMNKEDLINHLGTIARSGSAEFIQSLSGDKQKDMALIGQFGVGFYASFMVADKVIVHTQKAGDSVGYTWESNGLGSFSINENKELKKNGTTIILHLKKEALEYLDPIRIRFLIKQYSDHISIPVVLDENGKEETLNTASALWTRSKSDITPEQYKDFYQSVSHAFDAPWMTLHYRAEGAIEYTGLLFIPEKPPFNLFQPDRKSNIQLYVNRVFISDDIPDFMPYFLRFVCGVIDTKDLPLNVSREMLQQTPVLTKIKTGLTRRILSELKKRAQKPLEYNAFWNNFGIVFKEGLYEPNNQQAEIADLCRFNSLNQPDLISFEDYVQKMPKEQEQIYYITGSDLETVRHNPQLEGFSARGIDVLLLTDPIDEFWTQTFTEFKGKKIVSVMHAGAELNKIKPTNENNDTALSKDQERTLIQKMKAVLENQADVQSTDRLTKSAVALITPAGQMSMHLERLMQAHGQQTTFASQRILQINPKHPLIIKLGDLMNNEMASNQFKDTVLMLFDGALLAEGEPLKNPAAYTERLNQILLKGL